MYFYVKVIDESELDHVWLYFKHTGLTAGTSNEVYSDVDLYSYDADTGVAQVKLTVTNRMPRGEWNLYLISTEDIYGNHRGYNDSDDVTGFKNIKFSISDCDGQIIIHTHCIKQMGYKSATCEAVGWYAYEYCTDCDYSTYKEIPAKGHKYVGVVTTQPTCKEGGIKTYSCCNDVSHTYTETLPAKDHNIKHVAARAASCNAIGWEAYEYCKNCDYSTYKEIPVGSHDIKQVSAQAATCEDAGWNAYEYCTNCDYSTYVEIPAIGHDYDSETTKKATCTKKGEKTYTCQNDPSHVYTEKIPKKDHDYDDEYTVDEEPTATQPGLKSRHCSRCDSTTDEKTIPATGISYRPGSSDGRNQYYDFTDDISAWDAAYELYEMGLMKGTGVDGFGNPVFELERNPNRFEAVTMLVRLLGKEEQALTGSWYSPFTDVADWAKPYVGYAYQNGLTNGVSATQYGSSGTSATQYITFVLRALGYESGVDFQWDTAWELSDELGITNGEYNAYSVFTRGDVALISYRALQQEVVGYWLEDPEVDRGDTLIDVIFK